MEKEIIMLLIGGLISWLGSWYYFSRKKSWVKKVEELEAHLSYIEKYRKSSVELNRAAFSGIFLILLLISLAQFIPIVAEYFAEMAGLKFLYKVVVPVKFFVYMAAVVAAYHEFKLFSNVSNKKRAETRINKKLEILKKKIENA